MRSPWIAVCLSFLLAGCTPAGGGRPTVERMYVFDCGTNRTADLSRWTPGANVGRAMDFSVNCYLIQHEKGLLVWDSGLADEIAALPDGRAGPISTAILRRTLLSQMSEVGVWPGQVTHVAFSHTHGDHVGNANYFTAATLYIQEAEYDAAFGPTPGKFGFNPALYDKLRANKTVKLKGDHDVFGDGSVVIIATPGHTPGHQSLLVRLPRSGPVILSGDMVHLEENWSVQRVPSMNFSAGESTQSMQKIAALMAREKAALWINHDKAQSDRIVKAPRFID